MLRLVLIILIVVSQFITVLGQQLPTYSQYTFNKFLLNPAAAGSDGYTAISVIAREQWVGFKGTPRTHAITGESRILKNSFISKNASVRRKRRMSSRSGRVGWGAHLFNDKNGPIDRTGIEGTYSYHIDFSDYRISFGLSVMLFQFRLKSGDLIFSDDLNDDLISGNKQSLYIPDSDFGVYFSSREFYAGLSIMQILQSAIKFGNKYGSKYGVKRHYNLMGGYIYNLNDNFTIEPSFLLKVSSPFRPQLDLSTMVIYKRDYWGGISFRTGSALIIFAGTKINRYFIGYAFDYNFNSLMSHTVGSHEIMLSVKLGDSARRYKWLNIY
ncbi:MAG: type IX secretion system membrane protein PorP/SprF [Bacteroidales bacterium]|nr:MAG: type IX secretion system membrane protein PorP/SprF [Bacteroidales bacterium]